MTLTSTSLGNLVGAPKFFCIVKTFYCDRNVTHLLTDGYESDDFAAVSASTDNNRFPYIRCSPYSIFSQLGTHEFSDISGRDSGVVGRAQRKRRRKYSEETRQLMLEMHERCKLLRPRILRTDFRRNFAAMCVNVFNSGDYRTVIDYIGTYCTRDVAIQHNDYRPCKS